MTNQHDRDRELIKDWKSEFERLFPILPRVLSDSKKILGFDVYTTVQLFFEELLAAQDRLTEERVRKELNKMLVGHLTITNTSDEKAEIEVCDDTFPVLRCTVKPGKHKVYLDAYFESKPIVRANTKVKVEIDGVDWEVFVVELSNQTKND